MSQRPTFLCPSCNRELRAPEGPLPPSGVRGSCPYCKNPIVFEASEPDPPPYAVKRPDGSTRNLTQTEVEDQIRAGEILAWDHISASGGQLIAARDHAPFERLFPSRDTQIQSNCWEHRGRPAAMHCRQCGRGSCSSCVPRPERIDQKLIVCLACEGVLEAPDPRLKEVVFWQRLDEVFLYPLRDFSWVTTMILGFLLGLASSGAGLLRPRAFLVVPICLAFVVYAIQQSAKGDKKMGYGPDTSDPLELAGLGFTAILVTVVAFLPLVLFNIFVVFRGLPGALLLLNAPLAVLSLAYYPMALGMTATFRNRWLALRPDIVFAHALKIPRDYGILLAFCIGLSVTQAIVELVGARVPFLGGVSSGIVSAYFWFVEAHVIGWTLYMNADALEWS